AYQLRYLLTHPEIAAQLGKNGREHVKENFLMTTNVKRWLILFQIMLGMTKPVKPDRAVVPGEIKPPKPEEVPQVAEAAETAKKVLGVDLVSIRDGACPVSLFL